MALRSRRRLGDVDGDGRPDLYVGAFAARKYYAGKEAPVPNMLFLNGPKGFTLAEDPLLQFLDRNARCAGVLFVDLDNDGDLDLVVSNHVSAKGHLGSRLFENQGSGRFRDVTPKDGAWPDQMGARNISAVDFNGDGLLDLVVADGTYGRKARAEARLIDEAALVQALRVGRLAGAGLDVFAEEPPPRGDPLRELENVVCTAHAAGIDLRSRDDMGLLAARAIVALYRGEWPEHQVVNPVCRTKFHWT